MRHSAKLDRNLRGLSGEPLAGAEVEWHALPAPVIDEQPERDKRLGLRIRQHPVFFAVTRNLLATDPTRAVLAAHNALVDGVPGNRTNSVENVHLLVPNLVGFEGNHGFHRHQTEQLHQVILHHVTKGPGVVVIAAPMLDPDGLYRGDGDTFYITPVPDWLEERIGKAECQNVLHGFLAQIMVNAEDL